MRRLPRAFVQRGGRLCTTASYAANLFRDTVVPNEIVPFPTWRMSEEEGDNLEVLVRHLQETAAPVSPAQLVEWCIPGMRVANEYGGLQLSQTAHAAAFEAMAMCSNLRATDYAPFIQHVAHVTHLLQSAASKEVKGKYLPAMSDASAVMGWAVAEAHAGSDVCMNNTVATAKEEAYEITGTKVVPWASKCTHFVVYAKTPGQTQTEAGPVVAEKRKKVIVFKARGLCAVPQRPKRCYGIVTAARSFSFCWRTDFARGSTKSTGAPGRPRSSSWR